MTDFVVTRKNVGGVPTSPKLVEFDLTASNIIIQNVPCEASVYAGAAVYMQASGIAKNAIATSLAESNILGLVESKQSTTVCTIRVLGVTDGIFAGLDVTTEYFLSDSVAGGVQTSVPTASGSVALKIGQPYSATEMLVLKGQRTVRL